MMNTTTSLKRWAKFAIAIVVLGFVWLILLPLVGAVPRVSKHVANQKRLGIDPSALFYTELEIASGIAHHVERLHDSHAARFWSVPRRTSSDKTAAEIRIPE